MVASSLQGSSDLGWDENKGKKKKKLIEVGMKGRALKKYIMKNKTTKKKLCK